MSVRETEAESADDRKQRKKFIHEACSLDIDNLRVKMNKNEKQMMMKPVAVITNIQSKEILAKMSDVKGAEF